jgi:hypothetical protein
MEELGVAIILFGVKSDYFAIEFFLGSGISFFIYSGGGVTLTREVGSV